MKGKVQERLNQAIEEGNENYQKALEYKMSILEREKIEGLKADSIAMNVEKTRELMINLERYLSQEDGQKGLGMWLFGLDKPTALDAHLVVFIERMRDIGRSELIPEGLQAYADRAKMVTAWKSLMQGRSTMVGNK
ncbi:hypothetical protein N7474_004585 [Penicillium riverlandense]|uniref:uncharacterized protein n=1 Tax=Penicillium riverlandense TaxID=1903569 RepID=UPI0025491F8D|nr:uncharacterized protein N7474_004585 [Penicillium riverlandense]KAJ5818994.1 hypothetical protein N7474_004585 [Penicillium riverlandense]